MGERKAVQAMSLIDRPQHLGDPSLFVERGEEPLQSSNIFDRQVLDCRAADHRFQMCQIGLDTVEEVVIVKEIRTGASDLQHPLV